LPLLKDWFINAVGASVDRTSYAQPEMTIDQIPNMITCEPFMNDLKQTQISYSDDPQDRLFRAHGLFTFQNNYYHFIIFNNF